MKKTQHTPQPPSEEELKEKAEQGVFDRNPLLATPHEVVCRDCKYRNRVVFLEYLKSGQFEIGETRMIEVTFTYPTATGLGRALERATPIIIHIKCKKCGSVISYSPMNLEYLLFTESRDKRSGIYV